MPDRGTVTGLVEEKDRDEERRPLREAFVRDLYRILERKGISQRQLRDDLGWGSHTTINRWRHLIAEPAPDELFELERYLEVPPGSLSRHLGYVPAGERNLPKSIVSVIEADPVLPPWGKEILLTAYQQIMRSLGKGRRR